MGIDLQDLPPFYQVQAMKQIAEKEREKAERKRKYHNKPAERRPAGKKLRFDSQKEARRYDELMTLLMAGEIMNLRLQPQFTLQEAYTTPEGERVRAIRYQADFSYLRRGKLLVDFSNGEKGYSWTPVVEDVKSRATRTRVYLTKKKLMQERFNITIQEV